MHINKLEIFLKLFLFSSFLFFLKLCNLMYNLEITAIHWNFNFAEIYAIFTISPTIMLVSNLGHLQCLGENWFLLFSFCNFCSYNFVSKLLRALVFLSFFVQVDKGSLGKCWNDFFPFCLLVHHWQHLTNKLSWNTHCILIHSF